MLKYILATALAVSIAINVADARAFKELTSKYEEEFKIELNNYNTSREEMIARVACEQQIQKQSDDSRVSDRLKYTTDVLESLARCAYFKIEPEHCLGKLDLNIVLQENRDNSY